MQSTRQLQMRVLANAVGAHRSRALARVAPALARPVSTTPFSEDENLRLLNAQRSVRPTSPHFTIYQPQLTWVASIAHRVTGVGMSAGLYAGGMSYLFLPMLGVPFDSAHIVDTIAHMPYALKLALKVPIAAAFSFHSLNGIRHLLWDTGSFLNLKGAYASGYAVLAATAVSTVGLCAL